jgi:hypothetical protein
VPESFVIRKTGGRVLLQATRTVGPGGNHVCLLYREVFAGRLVDEMMDQLVAWASHVGPKCEPPSLGPFANLHEDDEALQQFASLMLKRRFRQIRRFVVDKFGMSVPWIEGELTEWCFLLCCATLTQELPTALSATGDNCRTRRIENLEIWRAAPKVSFVFKATPAETDHEALSRLAEACTIAKQRLQAVPKRRTSVRQRVQRDVDWFYRHRVRRGPGDSISAIAKEIRKSRTSDPRNFVRDRIVECARILDLPGKTPTVLMKRSTYLVKLRRS